MLVTMLTLLPIFTSSMVINRITTTDDRELTYVSLAGGADIYISGVGLGTPFRPPTIFVGPTTCDVQSFTSSNTRIHCVLNTIVIIIRISVVTNAVTIGIKPFIRIKWK